MDENKQACPHGRGERPSVQALQQLSMRAARLSLQAGAARPLGRCRAEPSLPKGAGVSVAGGRYLRERT